MGGAGRASKIDSRRLAPPPLVEAALRHVYLEAPPPDGLSHEELLALRGLLIMNGE